jgi:hypothetical protein
VFISPTAEALQALEDFRKLHNAHATVLRCGPRAYRQLIEAGDWVIGNEGRAHLCGARIVLDDKVFDFKAEA